MVGARPPTLADAEKVPSLRPFLDETLRMFPPVAILSRVARAEDDIGGHKVAPGDRVLLSVIGIHQNPAAWESPREFRLERHKAGAVSRPDRRSVFMPFSAGPRICGGARFAQMEMSLALMLILQRCRLDLPAPLPLAFDWGASMRRRGGQTIRVTSLRGSSARDLCPALDRRPQLSTALAKAKTAKCPVVVAKLDPPFSRRCLHCQPDGPGGCRSSSPSLGSMPGLDLQRLHEALRLGVVVWIAAPAH